MAAVEETVVVTDVPAAVEGGAEGAAEETVVVIGKGRAGFDCLQKKACWRSTSLPASAIEAPRACLPSLRGTRGHVSRCLGACFLSRSRRVKGWKRAGANVDESTKGGGDS